MKFQFQITTSGMKRYVLIYNSSTGKLHPAFCVKLHHLDERWKNWIQLSLSKQKNLELVLLDCSMPHIDTLREILVVMFRNVEWRTIKENQLGTMQVPSNIFEMKVDFEPWVQQKVA